MKNLGIIFSATVVGISVVLAITIAVIVKQQENDASLVSAESKFTELDRRLDSLATEIHTVIVEQNKNKDIVKTVSFRTINQTPAEINRLNAPLNRLPDDYSVTLPSNEALFSTLSDVTYKAVHNDDSSVSPAVVRTVPNINNISFGAGLYTGSRTEVSQQFKKVSVDSARLNGLVVKGRASFPNGAARNKKATLQFILSYIPSSTPIEVTSFTEDLTEPDMTGSFFHRIFLQTEQYKKGLYYIVVYYDGSIVSYQSLTLI